MPCNSKHIICGSLLLIQHANTLLNPYIHICGFVCHSNKSQKPQHISFHFISFQIHTINANYRFFSRLKWNNSQINASNFRAEFQLNDGHLLAKERAENYLVFIHICSTYTYIVILNVCTYKTKLTSFICPSSSRTVHFLLCRLELMCIRENVWFFSKTKIYDEIHKLQITEWFIFISLFFLHLKIEYVCFSPSSPS